MVDIAASRVDRCVVVQGGSVWCWGYNSYGQLGTGAASDGQQYPTPRHVVGLDHVVHVAVGDGHSCALRADGTVWCWGSGSGGALGFPIQSAPTAVAGVTDVTQIASGGAHVCAVTASRHVTCWGREFAPEPSAVPAALAPFEVADLADVVHVGVGGTHACALRGDGTVRCWGKNQYGELGDGSGKPQRMATVMW